ncbi:MAG: GNAT family N-acetyltransferase [Coriobacteriia bacterium]|nr:GNAT family N-acetyltransferase [Coriobacteriia bacterium]
MIIREATLDDAPELVEYAAELFSEGLPGIFSRPAPTHAEGEALVPSRPEPEVRAWETNPRAIALCEGLGFKREGACRRAVIRDGRPVDVVILARLL